MENEYLNPNYYQLFEKPEEEAREINKGVQKLMQTCLDMDELKKKIKEMYGNGIECFEYTYLNDLICCLTTSNYEYGTEVLLNEMKRLFLARDITDFGDGKYKLDVKDGTIIFRTISSLLRKYVEEDTFKKANDLKHYDEILQKIETRNHKCHALSMDAVIILKTYLGLDTTLVTGYNSYYVPNNKYLHSWLETEKNGQIYVIDSTSNTVMNKEGYYLLRQVDENEIISGSVICINENKY